MKVGLKLVIQIGYHLQSLPNKIPLNLGNYILLERHFPTNYANLNCSRSIFVTNYERFQLHEKNIIHTHVK